MPMLIPTPDELRHLSPAKRAKILRVVRSILMEADEHARAAVDRVEAARAEGERIRAHARLLETYTVHDDPLTILKRRQILLEATR